MNLIAFFRRSIKNVGRKSLDFRSLLSDGTDRTIRIIDDKNDAYATVFADLIIFVIKIIQLSLVSLFGSEAKFVSARIFVDGILNRNRVGTACNPIWDALGGRQTGRRPVHCPGQVWPAVPRTRPRRKLA